MGEIGVLAGGVDDQVKVIAPVGDHQVVEDAALFVGQDRVTGLAGGQALDIARHQGFESRRRVVPQQFRLPHVRYVEDRSLGPGMQVFGDDAFAEMYRHVIAGEGHHLGVPFPVQGIERGLFQVLDFLIGHLALRKRWRAFLAGGSSSHRPSPSAPFVPGPERFTLRRQLGPAGLHLQWGGALPEVRPLITPPPAFQSLISLRSGCLRVSGAVAPSAPAQNRQGGWPFSRSLPQGSYEILSLSSPLSLPCPTPLGQ